MSTAATRYEEWMGVKKPLPDDMNETASTGEDAEAATTSDRRSILAMIEEFASIASILRMAGAAIVIASMSAFLMQGWEVGNDIRRFYMLLSQTALLALGGFGLSYIVKENKGARVFFGLSIVSIVADMTTLGALVFSIAHLDTLLDHYPAFAHWKAASSHEMLMATVAGVVTLIPIAWFGFMVMARRSAKLLTLAFITVNLLLLVPVRESWALGAVAMASVLLPLLACRHLLKQDSAMHTKEGYFAMVSLFIPAGIIIGRSLFLYQMDNLLQLMLALTAHIVLRVLSGQFGSNPRVRHRIAFLSFITAGIAAYAMAGLFDSHSLAQFLVFGVYFAAMGMDIALRNPERMQAYATFTCNVLAASVLVPFITIHNSMSILAFILAGVGICITGKMLDARKPVLMGLAMTLVGIGQQLYSIIVLLDFSNWLTLAVLGTSAIIGASVIERHGAVIRVKARQWIGALKNR